MLDLFDNVWGSQDQITEDHTVNLTLPVRRSGSGSCLAANICRLPYL